MVFSCQRDSCTKTFVYRKHLLRHLRTHDGVNFKCELCSVILIDIIFDSNKTNYILIILSKNITRVLVNFI